MKIIVFLLHNIRYLFFIIAFYIPLCYSENISPPPSIDDITQNINNYQKLNKASEIDKYIDTLQRRYPYYIPIKIIHAVNVYNKGNQVEYLIDSLEKIINALDNAKKHTTPLCIDALISRINLAKSDKEIFDEIGVSAEDRARIYSKSSGVNPFEWYRGFVKILSFCPSISIQGKKITVYPYNLVHKELIQMNQIDLENIILNDNGLKKQLDAIYVYSLHGINADFFLRCINDKNQKLSTSCAARSSEISNKLDLAKLLVEFADGDAPYANRKNAIWALFNIPEINKEIRDEKQKIINKNSWESEFAKQLLE